jgi:hypothetical protein
VSAVLGAALNVSGLKAMHRISRAYGVAETVTECPGCKEGKISVELNDGDKYHVACPLLDEKCQYGQKLHENLDKHALNWTKTLPGLPMLFYAKLGTPQMTTAIRGANTWSYSPKTFLILHGEHGTGKSFAAAYALYVMFRKKLSENWKYQTALGAFNAMWVSAYRATTQDDLFESARTTSFLVLDDLGSEENTGRAKARISEIVSERYNQRRITILTMNNDVLDLGKIYSQRMADRAIGAGHVVYCGGESLRLVS